MDDVCLKMMLRVFVTVTAFIFYSLSPLDFYEIMKFFEEDKAKLQYVCVCKIITTVYASHTWKVK